MKMRPAHLVEWLALRGLMAHLRRGEMDDAARRIEGLAGLGRRILRREWAWCRTNLRLVYGPGPTEREIDALSRQVFENIFMSHTEGFRAEEMVFDLVGVDHALEALALGRGLIMTSVHLGCWEAGLKPLSEAGLPLVVVYRHANNPLSEKVFSQVRSTYGVEMIQRRDQRAPLKAMREKKALSLMVDINTRQGGVAAPFLGVMAMCPPGPARLAMKFGCPVVPAVAIRQGPGRGRIEVGAALEPPKGAASPERSAAFTARINSAFEDWILGSPEQYNWLHARWRSRPDGALWRSDLPLSTVWAQRSAPFPPLPDRLREMRE